MLNDSREVLGEILCFIAHSWLRIRQKAKSAFNVIIYLICCHDLSLYFPSIGLVSTEQMEYASLIPLSQSRSRGNAFMLDICSLLQSTLETMEERAVKHVLEDGASVGIKTLFFTG
jgi:hypothetical protein